MDRVFEERPKFANWVNKVLGSHQAMLLNKFRIYCDLGNSYLADLDEWLRYAFERSVQRLEVNLLPHGPGSYPSTECYVFPSAFVAQKSWHSLKLLILKHVLISGGNLEFFLRNCKFLESVVVCASRDLQTLNVCGPSLTLRHLDIGFCPLKTLIISNVNLISLKIDRPKAMTLRNVPQLVHVEIRTISFAVEDFVDRLSCCFFKLEVLSLFMNPKDIREYERKMPELPALKQLVVVLYLFKEESMSGLTSFFRAAPNLEKFVIKTRYPFRKMLGTSRKSENVVQYSVQHLRVVEMHEYRGRSVEIQLVKYLLENAMSLEKIVVDPRYEFLGLGFEPWFIHSNVRSLEAEITNDGRRCAEKQLGGIIPSHVALQIL
ncbi:OLC1v1004718C1 [Oldenlandia corymbosa var. corymbosa]|uniref:OLC1v1004718C1 n=1 Tax=Oldenlandia corymbosa var. corymbosa TaxID=529605 RepID=A0AAV1DFE8_OLDCO|nr:OLC1v1004718C1 [Oldenlandia corymbosa var. corymbosa]